MLRHQKHIVLKQRGLHLLALAGLLALHQRGHGAHGAKYAAHDVIDARARAQRVAGPARHIGQATHHLHHFVQGGAVLVGAGQKAFVADIDQARMARRQSGVVQPQFFHGRGFEVLADDVRPRH